MEHSNVEDQVSVTIDDYEILGSGNESDEYDSWSSNGFGFLKGSGMMRVEEKGLEHEIVAKSFLSGLGSLSTDAEVVAVHKNKNKNKNWEKAARAEAFRIFSEAVASKCGGDANIKYAWYGGGMDEICEIVSRGFSGCSKHMDSESHQHGVGVYLSPGRFSIDCVSSSAEDENGLRHMLLCRVILGRVEAISAGSTQFHPSSYRFDTGVDDVLAPRKYIVWGAFMNSHIQPTYVISFKAPQRNGTQMKSVYVVKPTSAWMSFPTLMSALSRFLDARKMGLIQKCHKDFIRNKIPRPQLINRVRQIAGDELLIAVIKKYNETR